MVVQNPNNWHWIDKNCIEWAKKYFENALAGISTGSEQEPLYAQVKKVNSVEGDCEINQRKGKVISLFDMKIVLGLTGHVSGVSKWEGSITIPEVAFDTGEDEYQFNISIYEENSTLSAVRPVIRDKLVPQIKAVFNGFGKELMAVHSADIQVPEDQVQSQFTKANQKNFSSGVKAFKQSSTTCSASSETAVPVSSNSSHAVASHPSNTSVIHLEPTFNVSASDLYATYIEKKRIEIWSRSQLIASSSGQNLVQGEEFSLFCGNVTGILFDAQDSKRLVFRWRLNSWNPGHMSTMEIDFHESPEYHETKMVVSWSGIPIGEEDRAKDNFEEFYVRSVKLAFGYGSVF